MGADLSRGTRWFVTAAGSSGGTLAGCRDAPEPPSDGVAAGRSAARPDAPGRGGILDITAPDLALEGPAQIPSGWTTVRFHGTWPQHPGR